MPRRGKIIIPRGLMILPLQGAIFYDAFLTQGVALGYLI